jgi:threonine/homoserine/homoserine lactone efflux protein
MLYGAAICAANPYFTGWWATIGVGQLAHCAPRTPGEYLAFYLGHEGADYTWYFAVGAVIAFGSRWLTPAVHHGLIGACAILIALVGVWFFVQGLRLWRQPRP